MSSGAIATGANDLRMVELNDLDTMAQKARRTGAMVKRNELDTVAQRARRAGAMVERSRRNEQTPWAQRRALPLRQVRQQAQQAQPTSATSAADTRTSVTGPN
jgi:hypothetical protein